MYRCEKCHAVVGPRVPAKRVIIQARSKLYPPRERANSFKRMPVGRRPRVVWTDDPGGRGAEIVRELSVCPRCAESLTR